MSGYNIKSIKQEFKDKGIFYTPPELANILYQYIGYTEEIYDPTCGDGSLLRVFGEEVRKYGQEINDHQLEIAKKIPNFEGYCADTLLDDGFKYKKFKSIIANPPFSIKREQQDIDKYNVAGALPPKSKADYAFILHILDKLDDDGHAVILSFPGVLYRGNNEGIIRKWLVDNNYIDRIVHIPGNTFIDTKIPTCIICIKKNRKTTDVIFEDRELKEEKVIGVGSIISNNYCLSVSQYIYKEEYKVVIDPQALMSKARNQFVMKLRKDLEFDRQICLLEGRDFNVYVDGLIKEIQKFKTNLS